MIGSAQTESRLVLFVCFLAVESVQHFGFPRIIFFALPIFSLPLYMAEVVLSLTVSMYSVKIKTYVYIYIYSLGSIPGRSGRKMFPPVPSLCCCSGT